MQPPKVSPKFWTEESPNATSNVIGCDIGGANLKLANCSGKCTARGFPMWLRHNQLAESLGEMFREYPVTEDTQLALTMTGELADCFATRRDGVRQILAQAEQAFAPERTHVYAVGNRWLSPQQAVAAPWDVAASNWHALAVWIGNCFRPETHYSVDLLLDIGSTTVDIIPMRSSGDCRFEPATAARTDRDRLELGQLVYTGLERTPIAAIVSEVTVNGRRCPVMAERFATSDDCYLILGLTSEVPDDCDTADNRPRTKAHAHARLARMIGEDAETLEVECAQQIATQVIDAQAQQVAEAISRNLPRGAIAPNITVVGHGHALALRALAQLAEPEPSITFLSDHAPTTASRCAPALAVANLLAEHLNH